MCEFFYMQKLETALGIHVVVVVVSFNGGEFRHRCPAPDTDMIFIINGMPGWNPIRAFFRVLHPPSRNVALLNTKKGTNKSMYVLFQRTI